MNKKGGALVEATLVFPVIILSLLAIIGILMFLFEEAATQAELHLAMQTEAGRQTGTFHGTQGSSNISLGLGFRGIHRVLNGKTSVTFDETDILSQGFRKSINGYMHLIDERKYVRYIDFLTSEEY